MDHEPSPLFNTKMLEVKPIAKLMDTYLKSSPKQKPPIMNWSIRTVGLPKGFCTLKLVAKRDVLILKFGFYQLFSMFIKQLNPME
jgi:hypothetical protein